MAKLLRVALLLGAFAILGVSAQDTCITCVTDPTNNLCEWPVDASMARTACPAAISEERAGCFLRVKEGVYTRDCVSTLNDQEFAECQSGENCKICQGTDCNLKAEFQRCYICDSEQDDFCVDTPNGAYIKNCNKYDDTCVSFVVANGKTGRGCSSETDTEPTYCPGTNCVECTGVECNSGLVPSYRLKCFQCDDSQFGCTAQQDMYASYKRACNNFNFQDQCYTLEDAGRFYRGCMSDNSPQSQICAANPERCEVCETSECNSRALTREATLSCQQCSRESCLTGTAPPTVKCQSPVEADQQESCYYAKLVGGDVQMGCTLDEPSVAAAATEFLTCNGDNCNAEYAPKKSELVCHRCMDTDENCKWRQEEKETPEYCQSMVLYGEEDRCYHYQYSDGSMRRGCLKDDRFFCYGYDCKTCLGNYCNSAAQSQACIQCSSADGLFESCAGDANEINAMQCPEEAYATELGCYSFKNDDDVVVRGCWNSAPEEHKAACAADEEGERCVRCTNGDGCNNKDHTGSAAALFVALPLLLASTLISLLVQ